MIVSTRAQSRELQTLQATMRSLARRYRGLERPISSSFVGLPCRILNVNHKKDLLRGLDVDPT